MFERMFVFVMLNIISELSVMFLRFVCFVGAGWCLDLACLC